MNIENKFNIEDIVFLITDNEQKARIVTSIQISKNRIIYCLACGSVDSWHYGYEIASQKNYLI